MTPQTGSISIASTASTARFLGVRSLKKKLEIPMICCICGRKAVKGYTIDEQRYCDQHAEDYVRRSVRDNNRDTSRGVRQF